ncbi:response regulator MprA [Secundilactobacillus odoratitofui DSM 19909 = JCM 15043]|uniref:Response regulator MprA n=1 Tax=Secundilactobacillus odoratitofui DSM 19909 = JCM 15043 TaxID=1423776 RepID=A0A0R1LSJ7_9LACO|nr:response regulator MprA [Secundilactobacillus odoratitofui DSM 19909 = JCM 15043]
MMVTKRILVVEDEPGVQALLRTELSFEHYDVLLAGTGKEALAMYNANRGQLDLIILDWMIPEIDGLGVLRHIRKIDTQIPIIFLTARDYSGDKVAGLDSGADDYLTKPFEMEELLARIRVWLRRQSQKSENQVHYQIGELTLDTKAHQVKFQTQQIQLTQREYGLLLTLMRHANQTLNRDEILDAVWGTDFVGQTNIVDVYIRQLRQKLEPLIGSEIQIRTVRGIGYTLSEVNQHGQSTGI